MCADDIASHGHHGREGQLEHRKFGLNAADSIEKNTDGFGRLFDRHRGHTLAGTEDLLVGQRKMNESHRARCLMLIIPLMGQIHQRIAKVGSGVKRNRRRNTALAKQSRP